MSVFLGIWWLYILPAASGGATTFVLGRKYTSGNKDIGIFRGIVCGTLMYLHLLLCSHFFKGPEHKEAGWALVLVGSWLLAKFILELAALRAAALVLVFLIIQIAISIAVGRFFMGWN